MCKRIPCRVVGIRLLITFFRPLRVTDEREGDHNGCRAGVCNPANYHRQTAIRPSRKNHWPAGGMVFRFAVHRQQR